MAELNLGKGLTAGKVASNVQKKLTRAQEKVGAARRRVWRAGSTRPGLQAAGAAVPHPPPSHSVASRHPINTSGDAVFWGRGCPLLIRRSRSQCHTAGTFVLQRDVL